MPLSTRTWTRTVLAAAVSASCKRDVVKIAPEPAAAPAFAAPASAVAIGVPSREILRLVRDGDDLFAVTAAPAETSDEIDRRPLEVFTVNVAAAEARPLRVPDCDGLVGFGVGGQRRVAVCRGARATRLEVFDGHWQSGAPLPECDVAVPPFVYVDRSNIVVACGDGVRWFADAHAARVIRPHLHGYEPCAGIALTASSVYLSFTSGEWGGDVFRYDKASGQLSAIDLDPLLATPGPMVTMPDGAVRLFGFFPVSAIYELADGRAARLRATSMDPAMIPHLRAMWEATEAAPFRLPSRTADFVQLPDVDFYAQSSDGRRLHSREYGVFDLDAPDAPRSDGSVPPAEPLGWQPTVISSGFDVLAGGRVAYAMKDGDLRLLGPQATVHRGTSIRFLPDAR